MYNIGNTGFNSNFNYIMTVAVLFRAILYKVVKFNSIMLIQHIVIESYFRTGKKKLTDGEHNL